MRPFAYFSGEGKVGRGTGPEAPKSPGAQGWKPRRGRGTGPEAPKQPKDLRFAAEASWCVLCVF